MFCVCAAYRRDLLLPFCRSESVAETLTVNSPRALRKKLVLSFETSETNHPATQRENTGGLNRQSATECDRWCGGLSGLRRAQTSSSSNHMYAERSTYKTF